MEIQKFGCCIALDLDGRKVSLGSSLSHCFESSPGSYRYTLTWIVCRQTVIDWVYFPNGCVLLSLGIFNVQDIELSHTMSTR